MRLAPNSVLFLIRMSNLEKKRGRDIPLPEMFPLQPPWPDYPGKLGPDNPATSEIIQPKYPASLLGDAHLALFWSLPTSRVVRLSGPDFKYPAEICSHTSG
jgi:hypothetical protein